jgi:cysteine desulfurase
MREYLETHYLNPSSVAGQVIQGRFDPVAGAKRAIASLLGSADLAEGVLLTSGASEANSWAVLGAMEGRADGHMVVSAIEHPSLRRAVDAAARRGHAVSIASVDGDGRVDEAAFRATLRPETCFVSVMLANNETGVIQPLDRLSRHVREVCPDAVIHCDATAAVGRIAMNLEGSLAEVDLLSLSGHKFHGPKGIGALFVRPGFHLSPMVHGEQEEGLRGGTTNTPGAAGIGEAARLVRQRRAAFAATRLLRDELEGRLLELVPAGRVNGQAVDRLPNTTSIVFPGLDAADAVDRLAMSGICISTGSACRAGATSPSSVLLAMGLSYADALSTLRFSLSHETTRDEIEAAVAALAEIMCVTA